MLGGLLIISGPVAPANAQRQPNALQIHVDPADGNYILGVSGSGEAALHAGVAAEAYRSKFQGLDDLGMADEWTVAFSGLTGQPDLVYRLRAYPDKPFADLQVFVRNTTTQVVTVESIRAVAAMGNSILDLGGPPAEDRVLSDSFSEDRPNTIIRDLGDAEMHRGVGSQLIYNRVSHESFFAGALTSDRFLTILRLELDGKSSPRRIAAYEVDSTGTTEMETDEWRSLHEATPEDVMTLQSPVAPGGQLASERLLLSVNTDYHRQLETYGTLIRQLHHARVAAPTPMGWWSWTAYYLA